MPTLTEDTALQAAVAAQSRPAADRARDAARHPYESLTFWGLTPGMTVVEIEPGGASWWRHILEPYAAATGGRTMEEVVIEALRPMLKEWLDANLPTMVEAMVAKEISRITGKKF